jgi:hypothetical protein
VHTQGILTTGAPFPFLVRRINSATTSYLRIPDISGLPARHEIQHSAAATTINVAIAHSLERRGASGGLVICRVHSVALH